MEQRCKIVIAALVALILGMSGSIVGAQQGSLLRDLRQLVVQEDEEFLLTEIQRVKPYHAIRYLAQFQQMQDRVGGEFSGCLPDQLMNADEIPLPVDDAGVVETALYLARLRQANLAALAELGFPAGFQSSSFAGIPSPEPFPSLTLTIDTSVPTAFLEALEDGEVTMAEAGKIAKMPANQELLRFISDQCENAEARVNEQTLAYMIWKAGSRDPLDRLWRWVNPMNDFGYAGLAADATRYRGVIGDLQVHNSQDLADTAVARVVRFLPHGAQVSVRFALTPNCLTGDWTTPTMSGTSLLRIKAGWEEVVGRISAGIFRQYLMEQSAGAEIANPEETVGAARTRLGDEGLAVFYEMIATTVWEGSIGYISNPSAPIDDTSSFNNGADLINALAAEVIAESDMESARSFFDLERSDDEALIALGRHLAGLVAERDGPQAVTALLEQGSMDFFRRALEIESENGDGLFDQEVTFAVDDLSARLDR